MLNKIKNFFIFALSSFVVFGLSLLFSEKDDTSFFDSVSADTPPLIIDGCGGCGDGDGGCGGCGGDCSG